MAKYNPILIAVSVALWGFIIIALIVGKSS